jgi:hypothetical protein
MKRLCLIFLLILCTTAVFATRQVTWRNQRVTLSTSPESYIGGKHICLTIKKGNKVKRRVLERNLEDIYGMYMLKSKYVDMVVWSYRSIYWFRLSPDGKCRQMQGPWETDCAIVGVGKNTLLIGCIPLGTKRSWYYTYDASHGVWIKMAGVKGH